MQEERLRSGLFKLEKRKRNGIILLSTASYWEYVQIMRQTLLRGEQGKNWGEPTYIAVIANLISYKANRKVSSSRQPKPVP